MADQERDFISSIRAANSTIDEKVKNLCEVSLQLQEYSRILKQKSDDINQRLQSCLNLKSAA